MKSDLREFANTMFLILLIPSREMTCWIVETCLENPKNGNLQGVTILQPQRIFGDNSGNFIDFQICSIRINVIA